MKCEMWLIGVKNTPHISFRISRISFFFHLTWGVDPCWSLSLAGEHQWESITLYHYYCRLVVIVFIIFFIDFDDFFIFCLFYIWTIFWVATACFKSIFEVVDLVRREYFSSLQSLAGVLCTTMFAKYLVCQIYYILNLGFLPLRHAFLYLVKSFFLYSFYEFNSMHIYFFFIGWLYLNICWI